MLGFTSGRHAEGGEQDAQVRGSDDAVAVQVSETRSAPVGEDDAEVRASDDAVAIQVGGTTIATAPFKQQTSGAG